MLRIDTDDVTLISNFFFVYPRNTPDRFAFYRCGFPFSCVMNPLVNATRSEVLQRSRCRKGSTLQSGRAEKRKEHAVSS